MTRLLSKLLAYSDGDDQLRNDTAKFLLGRLLQAAWHSTTTTKQRGIEQAFDLVPTLRDEVIEFTEQNKLRLPKIFADFALLVWTDHSFRSSFLSKDVEAIFDRFFTEKRNLLGLSFLLWALKPFISATKFKESSGKVLNVIADSTELTAEEKARGLLTLRVVERDNQEMTRMIQKKLTFIRDKNPGLLTKLLPKPTRGAMPPSSKKRDTRIR